MIIKTYATESTHWYAADGTPAYRIIGKNGKERNTTVRDARERNLVPSVTTVLGLVAKPGLNTWLQQQVLLNIIQHEQAHHFVYILNWQHLMMDFLI